MRKMTAYQQLVEMITTLVEAEPGLLQRGDRTCIDCMANMQMLGIAHIHQSVVTLPAVTGVPQRFVVVRCLAACRISRIAIDKMQGFRCRVLRSEKGAAKQQYNPKIVAHEKTPFIL